MRKSIIILALILCEFVSYAQQSNTPLWLRSSAISPDGTTIVFSFKGDLYTVPVEGGRAFQLTTNPGYDSSPIWSPDGKKIAFASDRLGSPDIFIIDANGGSPKRLTTNSASEIPVTFRGNESILYLSSVMPSAESSQFPTGYRQVYQVNINGGRPIMFSSLPLESISFANDGKSFLYQDMKGYENVWRKHHTSSVTRDIWYCSINDLTKKVEPVKTASFTKITNFIGEDRNPVLSPDGKSFYYLSESDGNSNIYKCDLEEAVKSANTPKKQITLFKSNPVRYLTISNDGTLCFSQNGELYTIKNDGQPQKVKIDIISDNLDRDVVKRAISSGATEMAVSADGKQIAFIYHGDVYVTSTEYKTTKQITNTPNQERNIDFAPDGRTIAYSSERDGIWQIYSSTIVNKEEKFFPYATELKEEQLINSGITSFSPDYSPNGKEIAFLENRTTIKVLNLASKQVRTVMDGKFQYSYSDGDQDFQWSPDSKWILTNYIGHGGWNNTDVALVDASGNGVIHNLTNSGYTDVSAKWVLDGKAMIWASDRAGYRSHGSWGAESDIYIMFFDLDAYEKFRMTKEELALQEEADKLKKSEQDSLKNKGSIKSKKSKSTDKNKLADTTKEVKPLIFDLENSEDRIIRLTGNSSMIGDAILDKKGEKLYYITRFEKGMDLWVKDLKENKTSILIKDMGYGQLLTDKEGKTIYTNVNGNLQKITMADGKTTPISFEGVFEYKPYKEREYMYSHVWQQVKDKFYRADLGGVQWEEYKKNYEQFLPYINNNYDFSEMLSELLGELNGSHTGASYRAPGATMSTAVLGLFYDDNYEGDGLKIKEIIKKSPLALIKTDVKEGFIIEKIDGQEIKAGVDYYPILEGKAGKKVMLSIYDPSTKKHFNEYIKAISSGAQNDLLYQRWVERNRKEVEKLSGGKIGYIHIEGMDSPSFRVLYRELLGRYRDADAVVIDTRHNGGGWLHDDVITLLSAKQYVTYEPRGQYIGKDPYNKWTKPSCMLVCEDNYSNAHGTPWLYKTLKVGKLVGTPVPGTMTAVWWETLLDNTLVFGIPEVACVDNNGKYLENQQLEPDVLIYNSPIEIMSGDDNQLKAAVKTLQAK